MIKLMDQAAAKAPGLGEDFFARWLAEGKDQLLVLQGGEKGHVALIINDDDRKGGAQKFQGAGTGFGVQFLTPHAQQEPLQ